jgi:hypothetical protein
MRFITWICRRDNPATSVDSRSRQALVDRWHGIERALSDLRECKVIIGGDPATTEFALLKEQDAITLELLIDGVGSSR